MLKYALMMMMTTRDGDDHTRRRILWDDERKYYLSRYENVVLCFRLRYQKSYHYINHTSVAVDNSIC